MKQAYIVAGFLYLCLSAFAATEKQPVTLQELEKELVALSPKGRIVRSSRHLDTLLNKEATANWQPWHSSTSPESESDTPTSSIRKTNPSTGVSTTVRTKSGSATGSVK